MQLNLAQKEEFLEDKKKLKLHYKLKELYSCAYLEGKKEKCILRKKLIPIHEGESFMCSFDK